MNRTPVFGAVGALHGDSPAQGLRSHALVALLVRLLVAFAAAASLSACAIQLAPAYDAELAEGLRDANKDALTLFALVDNGSPQADYAGLADDYANVIASFEALRQRADARPLPPLTTRLEKLSFFRDVCGDDIAQECLNSSGRALGEIVDGMRMMRSRHLQGGLTAESVALIRGRYDIQIDQALTVETALER